MAGHVKCAGGCYSGCHPSHYFFETNVFSWLGIIHLYVLFWAAVLPEDPSQLPAAPVSASNHTVPVMPSHTAEAVVRWSPHSTPEHPRFVILNLGESNLRFMQAEAINGSKLEHRQLSQRSKLPKIRAFDWSPVDEALVAFGLSSGEAAICRIDDTSNDPLPFTVKNQRSCNAVSLNTKGLLAAGLDKVRNDFCLNIWDVEQRLSSWDKKKPGWGSAKQQFEPIRKLATAETISSIKFFPDQPDCLVAAVKGQFVRIYDLRDTPGAPAVQFVTRCAHHLSIDPTDENYFASASSGEPIVCVWDRRVTPRSSASTMSSGHAVVDSYQAGAVLELRDCLVPTEAIRNPSVFSVRYCKYKRGSLAVLGNNGQLQVFETVQEHVQPSEDDSPEIPPLLRTRLSRDVQKPADGIGPGGKDERVISFDFMPADYRLLGYRADGNLEVFTLNPPPPCFDVSNRGDMTIVLGDENGTIGSTDAEGMTIAETIKTIRARLEAMKAAARLETLAIEEEGETKASPVVTRRQERTETLSLWAPPGSTVDIRDVLALQTVERRRAEEGYLFNCQKNIGILEDDPWLQDLWTWVDGADDAAKDRGMCHDRLDLSFLGVNAVWRGDLGTNTRSRITTRRDDPPTSSEFEQAVAAINAHASRLPFDGVQTFYPHQRQLCLAICGWALSSEEFEAELRHIETHGPRTKAAAWAMFHSQPTRAIESLFKGSDSDRLVAMALAGYYGVAGLSASSNAGAWTTLCSDVAATVKDPWSKAILALVSTSDWASVIAEASLPVRDRVGVALRYCEDARLTHLLENLTDDCIARGDLEGICLTGIADQAVSLLQNYIIRTEDVQTAVLVMSFVAPVYVQSAAFDYWRAEYRARLDGYGLHIRRALYDTQHTKRARARDGRILIPPPPRQITVRCNFCDQSVAHDAVAPAANGDASSSAATTHAGNPLNAPTPAGSAGTVCPRCTRHLPRCGVCMMYLGVPDARRPGGSAAVEAEDWKERFLEFCNVCHHGYHAGHAREWFERHRMCAVVECGCLCGGVGKGAGSVG